MFKNLKGFKHVQIFIFKRCNKVHKIRTECYEKRNEKIKSIWKCIFQNVFFFFFLQRWRQTQKPLQKKVKERDIKKIWKQMWHSWSIQTIQHPINSSGGKKKRKIENRQWNNTRKYSKAIWNISSNRQRSVRVQYNEQAKK